MTARAARRLLFAWAVSALILTLGPVGPPRGAPAGWATLHGSRLGLFDVAANVALFVPLGVLAVRAGWARPAALAAGTALSFGIEFAQQWIPPRHPSSYDVVANTLGTLLGTTFSAPLVALGARVWIRPVRWTLYVAGGAAALLIAHAEPRLARLTFVFPFAVAVLGGLVGSTVCGRRAAFLLAAAGVTLVCAELQWPTPLWWPATATAGAALGTWATGPIPFGPSSA
jgi:hypothetical protein